MLKRIIIVATLVFGVLLGAWITLPGAQAAVTYCPATYVVRPGDTLSGIAARAGVNMWQLARLNGIWNVHHIYVGQVLCLPYALPEPFINSSIAVAPVFQSSLKLDVGYEFKRDAEATAATWTLGKNGFAGKRLSYPLPSGDAIETVARPETVWISSTTRTPGPIFWLARPSRDQTDAYILVVIGDPQPLLDLQLGFTQTITQMFGQLPTTGSKPVSNLAGNYQQVKVNFLWAELGSRDGTFIPLIVSDIDYHQTVESAQHRYEFPAFALHPAPAGEGYHLLMVLNDDGAIGPPGYGWRSRCGGWGGGGWFSGFLRSWYGC